MIGGIRPHVSHDREWLLLPGGGSEIWIHILSVSSNRPIATSLPLMSPTLAFECVANGVNLVLAVDWYGTGTLVLVVMPFTLASNSRPINIGHNVLYRAPQNWGLSQTFTSSASSKNRYFKTV